MEITRSRTPLPLEEGVITLAKARILIVEDESIVALDLRHRLMKLGYAVCAVTDTGESAIREAAEKVPDLILMDIRLKGEMNGIEAAQEIRTRFDTPVILLTALADNDTLHQAEAFGPNGFISKPFDEKELFDTIETVLDQHQ